LRRSRPNPRNCERKQQQRHEMFEHVLFPAFLGIRPVN
jgi:hypothetical protein